MNRSLMHRRLQKRHVASRTNRGGLAALRFGIVGLMAIFLSFVMMIALAAGSIFAVYAFYVQDLPPAEEIGRRSEEGFQTTRLYDRTGEILLYELIPETGEAGRRTTVPLSSIPENLRNGTIAMEDKTFYTNPGGINIEGFGRAVWGVVSGDYAGGGSSISQQLVRNVIMTFEERADTSPFRKIKEMVLSYELTRVYPGIAGRDRILELYLNNLFYGHFAFGVEAAAQTYFSKSVEELSLAECAMLVPLGNAPTKNPMDAPEEAKERQEIVLDYMFVQGYITAGEAQAAKAETLVVSRAKFDILYPHFSLYVRDQLAKLYLPGIPGNKLTNSQIYGGGLSIITTLDTTVQEFAQQTVSEQIAVMKDDKNANNAAVVVLDAKTGELLAMVGSTDYRDASIDGQVNMAISPRSPGSSIKPITYATAFAQGYTPATMLMDVRTAFDPGYGLNPYVPENYARTYRGPITVRRALAGSLNIPAVEMLTKVGYDQMAATAHAMGINTMGDDPVKYPHITLGGEEVTVLDMAFAFTVFANGGTQVGTQRDPALVKEGYAELEPVCVREIRDSNGNTLYAFNSPQRRGVLSPQVAFLINTILSDSQTRRQFFSFYANMDLPDRPVAAKTGTNNDFIDAWTVGYTPQYTTAVWVGNADTKPMHSGVETSADGSTTAAPIWKPIMEYLHQGKPVEAFERPAGIVTAIVDGVSGKLPTGASPSRVQEVFIEGTVPTDTDDMHKAYNICKVTGKLATEFCPADQVESQVFTTYPVVALDWVREQSLPQRPDDICDLHGPYLASAEVAITQPKLLASVSGNYSIIGNARSGGFSRYWLEFGSGMSPSNWQMVGPEHGNAVDNGVLETWVTSGLNGLYTLRLSVVGGAGLQQTTVPVVVDNEPPRVTVLPFDFAFDAQDPDKSNLATPDKNYFRIGIDEWANIQVDAVDNVAMDRVEFFLDGTSLGFKTVAPYGMRWTLQWSSAQASVPNVDWSMPPTTLEVDGGTLTIAITRDGDKSIYTETFTPPIEITTTQSITQVISYADGRRVFIPAKGPGVQIGKGGSDLVHIVYVVAYDKAGNQTRSEPVQFIVRPARAKEAEKQ